MPPARTMSIRGAASAAPLLQVVDGSGCPVSSSAGGAELPRTSRFGGVALIHPTDYSSDED
eukprot:5183715-Pyramimonas_sp.AAC.1